MADIINNYESIFLIDSSLPEDKIEELAEKFTALASSSGELVSVEKWGRKRTAYPIEDRNEAYYVLMNFKSAPSFPLELERIYGITEGIIRFITVKKIENKRTKKVTA